jgi:hypothetical protein
MDSDMVAIGSDLSSQSVACIYTVRYRAWVWYCVCVECVRHSLFVCVCIWMVRAPDLFWRSGVMCIVFYHEDKIYPLDGTIQGPVESYTNIAIFFINCNNSYSTSCANSYHREFRYCLFLASLVGIYILPIYNRYYDSVHRNHIFLCRNASAMGFPTIHRAASLLRIPRLQKWLPTITVQ